MRTVMFRLAVIVCIVGFGLAPIVHGEFLYTDSSKVNLLRQYDWYGNQLVQEQKFATGTTTYGGTGNDGSAWSYQGYGGDFGPGDTAGETFTFPAPHVIATINYQQSGYAISGILFEGFSTIANNWVTLGSTTSTSSVTMTSLSSDPVTKLRYTVSGPAANTYFLMNEIAAYGPTGQSIEVVSGYNILRDSGTNMIASSITSPNNTVWKPANNSGGALINGNYMDAVSSQTATYRAFIAYTLTNPQFMKSGHVGFYHTQDWNKWEVYTANGASMPALGLLSASDPTTIQAAGWTLQWEQTPSSGAFTDFLFQKWGSYKYVALVWNTQFGSATEFEIFGVPEPTSLALLALAGLACLRRRR